jgi:hypothetical protein
VMIWHVIVVLNVKYVKISLSGGEPAMTCWDVNGFPNIAPAAILEWKFGASKAHESDIEWLRQFTVKFPQTIGYAVTANRPGSNFLIDCIRVNKVTQSNDIK